MTIAEQKLSFIKEFAANSEDKSFLVLFSNWASFDDFGLQINTTYKVMARRAFNANDLLGLRASGVFLWANEERYSCEILLRILAVASDFVYDLEQEEYIVDIAAKNA